MKMCSNTYVFRSIVKGGAYGDITGMGAELFAPRTPFHVVLRASQASEPKRRLTKGRQEAGHYVVIATTGAK